MKELGLAPRSRLVIEERNQRALERAAKRAAKFEENHKTSVEKKIAANRERRGLVLGQVSKKWLTTVAQGALKNAGKATPNPLGAIALQGAPITPANTVTCAYCGYVATTKDHIIPYAYFGRTRRKLTSSATVRNRGITVDCCLECNVHLSSSLIPTVTDRATFLFRKLKVRKRYSWERLEHLERIALQG